MILLKRFLPSVLVVAAPASAQPLSPLQEMRAALSAPLETVPDTAGLEVVANINDTGILTLRFHNAAASSIGIESVAADMPRHPACAAVVPPMYLEPGASVEWHKEHCINNIPAGWHLSIYPAYGRRLIALGTNPDQMPRELPSETSDPNASRLLTLTITLDHAHGARQFTLKWTSLLVPWTPQ